MMEITIDIKKFLKYIGICVILYALMVSLLPKTRIVSGSKNTANGIVLDHASFREKVYHFDHFHDVTRSYLSIDNYPYYLIYPYNLNNHFDSVFYGDYVEITYAIEEGTGFFVIMDVRKIQW